MRPEVRPRGGRGAASPLLALPHAPPRVSQAPRFTLRQFARTPALWFQFTADWEELDWPLLQDPSEGAPWRSPFEWGFLWGGAPADPAPKSIGLAPADLAAALARDGEETRGRATKPRSLLGTFQ